MTTKKSSKTPITNSLLDFSNLPSNINQSLSAIPNYEDVGVKYQGYSKTLVNGNSYQLNRQIPKGIRFIGSGSFPNNGATLVYTKPTDENKDLYISGITFSCGPTGIGGWGASDIIELRSTNVSSPTEFYFRMYAGTQEKALHVNFNTPLIIKGNLYLWTYAANSGYLSMNINGWLE